MLEAVEKKGTSLQPVGLEIILEAVKQNGSSLRRAVGQEIVHEAVKQDGG